jgi:hypothetical protein
MWLLSIVLLSVAYSASAAPAQESLHHENIFHSPLGTIVLPRSFFWPRIIHLPLDDRTLHL